MADSYGTAALRRMINRLQGFRHDEEGGMLDGNRDGDGGTNREIPIDSRQIELAIAIHHYSFFCSFPALCTISLRS